MKGASSSSSSGSDGASDSSSPPRRPLRTKTRKPKYSRFSQQDLPSCKPILSPATVISTFALIGIIFIPIGLASLFTSEHVVEIEDRYELDCIPEESRDNELGFIQSDATNKTCIRKLTVPKQMKSPIYVYYQLSNFFQNHRRYVKSRSEKQLRSRAGENSVSKCEPEASTLDGDPIVPCGLIAWSLFNDTYKFSVGSNNLEVSKRNIAWPSDKKKFGSDVYPKNFQSGTLIGGGQLNTSIPLSEQEDLMIWMRTAALPTFRKLYGRIDVDLEANEMVTVVIQNNYNTYSFGGEKRLILSTTSSVGGKNEFLGVAYLTVGGLSLFLAVGFILLYVFKPRTLGDPTYLSWNKNNEAHWD